MKEQYEQMVVIFLDILGSREMSSFNEKYKIHKIFHNAVVESQDLQNTKAKESVIYTRKLFSFSDCAYIFYRFKDNVPEEKKDKNFLLQTALFNTPLMLTELLSEGYLVRGGVTFGDAYYDNLSFFGPAVEEAYLLESKKAITPRIILDEKIGKNLYDHEIEIYSKFFSSQNPSYKFMPKRSFIPTIVKKDKEDYIVNYFYLLEMELAIPLHGDYISLDSIKEKIYSSLALKINKYKNNDRIIEKLNWMMSFVDDARLSIVDAEYSGTTYIV